MLKFRIELFRGCEKRGTYRHGGKKQSCHCLNTSLKLNFRLSYKTSLPLVNARHFSSLLSSLSFPPLMLYVLNLKHLIRLFFIITLRTKACV
jgi:hypothetical protein